MQEVRRLRQERGWTQTELAFHSGLAPSVISQIENDKRDPSASTLRKLAGALEVEVPDLFPKARQAPLPLEDGPSLEELYAKTGCTTDWLLKPAAEWYAAFGAKSREEAREKAIRIAREVENEYLAIEPELFAAMRREKELHPGNVWRRGTYHALWQAAVSRYVQAWGAMEKALADTEDPLLEPDFPTTDVGDGLLGMTHEKLEELLRGRSQEKEYAY